MQNHVAYAEQAEGIQPDFGKGKWKQAAQPSQCTGQERVHGDGVKLANLGIQAQSPSRPETAARTRPAAKI